MPPTARHLVKAFVSSLEAAKGTHPLSVYRQARQVPVCVPICWNCGMYRYVYRYVGSSASVACTGMCTGKSDVQVAELPLIHWRKVRAKCEHPGTCVRREGAKSCLEYATTLQYAPRVVFPTCAKQYGTNHQKSHFSSL